MIWYKQKSLISDNIADKKSNAAVDKAVSADKEWDNTVNKKLNATADRAINTNKKQDVAGDK